MNNIYFYLVLSIFLYLIFTKILDNFVNINENYDQTLVPISSIISLSKSAQSMISNNSLLTNPGDLQLGANINNTGNLKVSGVSTFGSLTDGTSALNVTGDAMITNKLRLGNQNGTSLPNALDILNINNNLTFGWNTTTAMSLDNNSNLIISGNATIGENLQVNTSPGPGKSNLNIKNSDNTSSAYNQFLFGDGTGYNISFQSQTKPLPTDPQIKIFDNGNLSAININTPSVNLSGKLSVGSIDDVVRILGRLQYEYDRAVMFALMDEQRFAQAQGFNWKPKYPSRGS